MFMLKNLEVRCFIVYYVLGMFFYWLNNVVCFLIDRFFRIKDFEFGIEYCVILECFVLYVNDDNKFSEWLINCI